METMKVKIGEKIYDSDNEPIMVIMDETDKENINKVTKVHSDDRYHFVTFPADMNLLEVREWIYKEAV